MFACSIRRRPSSDVAVFGNIQSLYRSRQWRAFFWHDTGFGGNLGMGKALVFTIAVTLAAEAQRIDTERPNPQKVIRIATAPNHLSVIELGEPVMEVAAGSSSYKIEWRENKVFVQPLESGATTNLFIWTASGRQSYELVPAESVQDMQFAIDQEPAPPTAKVAVPEKPPEDPGAAQQAKLASDMLFDSTPVRLAGEIKGHARVEVILKDVYRINERLFVRYAIQNQGHSTYQPGTPNVFSLRSPRSPSSLYMLSASQLVGDSPRIKSDGQASLKVVSAQVRASAVPPGGTALGLVAVELPGAVNSPVVLKLAFPPDAVGEVTAVLVL